MRINLVCIGKTDQKEIQGLLQYYVHRLPKHWKFEIIELPDIKTSKKVSPKLIKKEEGKLFLSFLDSSDWVLLLDEKGKQYASREFSSLLNDYMNRAIKRVCILAGGAYGFSDEMYQRAQAKMALSKMTFTHQMVRLFIVEQLYRASQILAGKPYHND